MLRVSMKNKNVLSKRADGDLNLAVRSINSGNIEEAERLCIRFLEKNPHSFDAHQLMGSVCLHKELFIKALDFFDKALEINNTVPLVWSNRSLALMGAGKFDDAIHSVNQAITLDARFADALINKANILIKMERIEEALIYIDDYLIHKPNQYAAWLRKANLHFLLKQLNFAIPAFREALRIEPNSIEGLINFALALAESELYEESLIYLDKVIKINPNIYQAVLNVGVVYDKMGKFEKARDYMQQALKLNPNAPDILLNLGIVCQKIEGGLDQSLNCFNELIVQDSRNSIYYFNRGVTLDRLAMLDEAIADYDKAIELSDRVSSIQPRWNRALSLLSNGELKTGWEEYENRFDLEQMENRQFHDSNLHKRWNGDPSLIKNKRFFVLAEQGLGDTLQFSRYIKFLVQMEAQVILMVQKPLLELYQSLTYPVQLLHMEQPIPMFDYYCSMMSLPYLLRNFVDDIPQEINYLKADRIKVENWKTRLGPKKAKRVGLIWSGGFRPGSPNLWLVNKRRNIELSKLKSLRIEGIELHSLQVGELPESELLVLHLQNWDGPQIANHSQYLVNFTETAALLENLDLLISVDTSTPHLAGVLGRPVWLLNRFDTCWRWMLQRSDTPWYPSFRIFRQKSPDDWDSVVSEVSKALEDFSKS